MRERTNHSPVDSPNRVFDPEGTMAMTVLVSSGPGSIEAATLL
jgi:hypothetical protein